jgi:hypothetical protein
MESLYASTAEAQRERLQYHFLKASSPNLPSDTRKKHNHRMLRALHPIQISKFSNGPSGSRHKSGRQLLLRLRGQIGLLIAEVFRIYQSLIAGLKHDEFRLAYSLSL